MSSIRFNKSVTEIGLHLGVLRQSTRYICNGLTTAKQPTLVDFDTETVVLEK